MDRFAAIELESPNHLGVSEGGGARFRRRFAAGGVRISSTGIGSGLPSAAVTGLPSHAHQPR